MERTLVVLKPDAVQRAVMGEILMRFERAGLKVVGMKMMQPDTTHYEHHYETIGKVKTRRGDDVFHQNMEFMMKGPVLAMVLEGVEAVDLVRKMVGETEPKSSLPGTIRGDYAHMSYDHANQKQIGIPNIIHASGDREEAQEEIYHWFNDNELFEYQTVHESHVF